MSGEGEEEDPFDLLVDDYIVARAERHKNR